MSVNAKIVQDVLLAVKNREDHDRVSRAARKGDACAGRALRLLEAYAEEIRCRPGAAAVRAPVGKELPSTIDILTDLRARIARIENERDRAVALAKERERFIQKMRDGVRLLAGSRGESRHGNTDASKSALQIARAWLSKA